MALINLTVDLTDLADPKVASNDVLNLFPGDRLEFVSNPPGTPIAVELGTTLLALVKDAGLNLTPGDFKVHYSPGNLAAIIELTPPAPQRGKDAQGAHPDPPS